MTQSTFALLTTTGRAKEALALSSGEPLVISAIAIGDGTTVPSGGEKKLYHEIARKTVSGHGLVAGTTNTAYFDIHLAATDGPYTIREAGLYDAVGDLIAIACYDPPINKPTPESGQTVEGDVRLQIAFSNAENVIVQVDASMQVPLQRLTVKPWVPIKSIDTKQPPENPVPGDVYVIPATATGVWKGQSQKLAEFTSAGWAITGTPDGHGVGLPDGSIFIKIAGVYVPLTDLFDKRYSRLTTPPTNTYYVSPDGDDKNTGFSLKESFRTIDGAIKALIERYMTSKTINLIIATGTYDGFSVPPSFIGGWRITGNVNTPGQVIIDATKTSMRGANISTDGVLIEGLTIAAIYECIYYTGGSNLRIKDCHLIMGGVNSTALTSYNGNIAVAGNCQISGSGMAALYTRKGEIRLGVTELADIQTSRIEYNCSVSVANFYTAASGLVYIDPARTMLDGTCNGRRYVANTNGVIMLNGQNANFIPGTIDGMVSTGGVISY